MVFHYLPFVQQPPSPRAFYKQNMTGITFSYASFGCSKSESWHKFFSPCPPPSQTEWHFVSTKFSREENHFKKPQTSMVPIDTDQCSPFASYPQAKNNSYGPHGNIHWKRSCREASSWNALKQSERGGLS